MNPIETLEPRRLLSVSYNATTDVVTVTGAYGVIDVVSARAANGTLTVKHNAVTRTYPVKDVKRIVVQMRGQGEGDFTTLDPSVYVPAEIFSAGYHDQVTGGSGADVLHVRGPTSSIDGGAGNDTINLYATAAESGVRGGAGNDTFKIQYTQPQSLGLDGGSGTDTVDYGKFTSGIILRNGDTGFYAAGSKTTLNYSQYVFDNLRSFENLYGGGGRDYIYGTAGNNYLRGNGGNDELYGGAGNDSLDGGSGADALFGQDGNDLLYARDGAADFLSGGYGTDRARRDSADTVTGVEGTV